MLLFQHTYDNDKLRVQAYQHVPTERTLTCHVVLNPLIDLVLS